MENVRKPPTKTEYVAWRRRWVAQEYEKGKSFREIARALGVSEASAYRDYQTGG